MPGKIRKLYSPKERGQYFKGNGGYGEIQDANFQDLDYSQNFSLEAVVNMAPYENANWAGIMAKTSSYGLYNHTYAGWGLGLVQSSYYRAVFYGKVGDGTNYAAISGHEYKGRMHLLMTWSALVKN